jgi:cytoskeletal protein RodZ
LTGLHSDNPKHHGKAASAATTTPTSHPATRHHHATATTTSTTAPPTVSAPTAASAHTATYTVTAPAYSLTIAATTGQCWVDVTNTTTGAVLFTTTLQSGQSHDIAATGPVTVIAGAPAVFSATVNGAPVTLPPGNQAPFTLKFAATSTTPPT